MPDDAQEGRQGRSVKKIASSRAHLRVAAATSVVNAGVVIAGTSHAHPVAALLAAAASCIVVVIAAACGPRAPELLWTLLYARMLRALAREGIRHANDLDGVRHLMADLRRSAEGLPFPECTGQPADPAALPKARAGG
jgi:hypothetical protein